MNGFEVELPKRPSSFHGRKRHPELSMELHLDAQKANFAVDAYGDYVIPQLRLLKEAKERQEKERQKVQFCFSTLKISS